MSVMLSYLSSTLGITLQLILLNTKRRKCLKTTISPISRELSFAGVCVCVLVLLIALQMIVTMIMLKTMFESVLLNIIHTTG